MKWANIIKGGTKIVHVTTGGDNYKTTMCGRKVVGFTELTPDKTVCKTCDRITRRILHG